MARDGQRELDTEDRVMRTVARLTAWMEDHRQATTLLLIAVLTAGGAGAIYLNYRSDVREQAAVRLDQIRIAAQGTPPAELRSQLQSYVEQFGSTPQGGEARLLLAEMELERGAPDAAIRVLAPAVDLDDDPVGYNAGWMMAVAEEQRGNLEAAARWYEGLRDAARHDFQRNRARAARAELHVYAGEYAAAERIYSDLAATAPEAEDRLYRVRLGEVRAMAAADVAPPELPRTPGADGAGDAGNAGLEAEETPPDGASPAD